VFSSVLVCLFVDYAKDARPIFTTFDGKVAHGPRKKSLGCGGNPDHVTLWLNLG